MRPSNGREAGLRRASTTGRVRGPCPCTGRPWGRGGCSSACRLAAGLDRCKPLETTDATPAGAASRHLGGTWTTRDAAWKTLGVPQAPTPDDERRRMVGPEPAPCRVRELAELRCVRRVDPDDLDACARAGPLDGLGRLGRLEPARNPRERFAVALEPALLAPEVEVLDDHGALALAREPCDRVRDVERAPGSLSDGEARRPPGTSVPGHVDDGRVVRIEVEGDGAVLDARPDARLPLLERERELDAEPRQEGHAPRERLAIRQGG